MGGGGGGGCRGRGSAHYAAKAKDLDEISIAVVKNSGRSTPFRFFLCLGCCLLLLLSQTNGP